MSVQLGCLPILAPPRPRPQSQVTRMDIRRDRASPTRSRRRSSTELQAGVRRPLRRPRRDAAGPGTQFDPPAGAFFVGCARRRRRSRHGCLADCAPDVAALGRDAWRRRSSGCTSYRARSGVGVARLMLAHLEATAARGRRRRDGAGDRAGAAGGDRAVRVRAATSRSRGSATTGTRRRCATSASGLAGGRGANAVSVWRPQTVPAS